MSDLFLLESEPVINARRRTLNGREYVVAEVTLLKEGVLSGSKGPLFYPADEIEQVPGMWNGIPITYNHPMKGNTPASARDPEMWDKYYLGQVFNDHYDPISKARKAELWYDVEVTNKVDKRIIPAILNSKPINVSTGLFTVDEKAIENSAYNGKPYTHIARNYRADHLATLLDDRGACSIDDGCGINVNSSIDMDNSIQLNVFCATGEGGGIDPTCSAGGSGIGQGTKTHSVKLPKNKKKLNIAPAAAALKEMGYEFHFDEGGFDLKTKVTTYGITDPSGKKRIITSEELKDIVYGGYRPTTNSIFTPHLGGTEDSMNRDQLVGWLTTNCECWKGKEEVLKNEKVFTDEELKKLKSNQEKSTLAINTLQEVGTTLKLPKNATIDDLKTHAKSMMDKASKMDDDEDEEEDTDKKKGKGATMNKEEIGELISNHLKGLSEKERIELIASPTLNQLIKNGEEVINEKRIEIMKQLTANITDRKEKEAKLLKLRTKTLDQLKELQEFATINVAETKDEKETFLANFFGAQGGPTGTNNSSSSYDRTAILPPSINLYSDEEVVEEVA